MKTIAFTLLLAIFATGIRAQESNSTVTPETKPIQTLMNNNSNVGVMIGFNSGYTLIDNKDSYTGGVSLGLIADHKLTFGFAGKVFGCSNSFNKIEPGTKAYLEGGYGGFYLEPVLSPSDIIHVTLPCIIGAGGAAYVDHHDLDDFDDEWDDEDFDDYTIDSDAFFVLEPGLMIEMNVTSWIRVGVGATHRWVYGLDLKNTKADMLDGFSTNFSVKLGKF
ncbi:MAG: hypothetical protein AB9842_14150 [Bacteroidales bacterium]